MTKVGQVFFWIHPLKGPNRVKGSKGPSNFETESAVSQSSDDKDVGECDPKPEVDIRILSLSLGARHSCSCWVLGAGCWVL